MKLSKLIFGSSVGMITMGLIILVPLLMLLDFFGANITDDYVEGNMEYASRYKDTLNKNIKNGKGYISLNRILYFYLENENLSFDEIYNDNLNKDLNQVLPITDVCRNKKYENLQACKEIDLNQINEIQNKPFTSPVSISDSIITSFFMEERIVFDSYDIHPAWDLALSNNSKVYSVCDGIVSNVKFPYKQNITDTSGGVGNNITIKCNLDDTDYIVSYSHLYPNSNRVSIGEQILQGQQIAEVGTTGYSTGPHLHFQVEVGNKPIDGFSLIDFNT